MAHQPLGPYDLHETIGRGGMGTVYLGVNRDNGEKAAVKILSPAFSTESGFRERFESEIKSLEKLNHPNIVQLFGYGEQDGVLFYGMELIEGSNLQQELALGRRFDWREVLQFGIEICSALKHAHDHGIIHRDLKPANLLLTKNEHVKLTDFGIAKLFGNHQITLDGGVLGTADYMSPEQAQGIGATSRSDLYSLGGVLFCLLAGRPPFRGKSMAEVIHKVLYEEPSSVHDYASESPLELSLLIDQLLKKNPAERVPTARAVANRLSAIRHALTLREETSGGDILQMDTMADDSAMVSEEEFADLETVYEKDGSPKLVSAGGRAANKVAAEKPIVVGGAAVAKHRTHYTTVDEEHRQTRLIPPESEESLGMRIGIVAVLTTMLCLVGYSIWELRKPPTADELITEIERAANDGTESLMRKENIVHQFLKRFPKHEAVEQVAAHQEEIELERLQRQIEVTSRLRNASRTLAPVEQALVDAIRQETLNPVSAASDLADIIEVFSTDPEATDREKQCIRLAERNLRRLNSRIQRNADTYVSVLENRVEFAYQLRDSDPHQSQRILVGIVRLYDDKPWAKDVVAAAKQLLGEAGR